MSRADRLVARNRWRAWKKVRRRARRRGEVFDRDTAVDAARDRAITTAKKSRSP